MPRLSTKPTSTGIYSLALRNVASDELLPIAGHRFTIGAGARCSLRVDGEGVSPLHCLITEQGGRYRIRRWGGQSRLNGDSFSEADLSEGDQLEIAGIVFEVSPFAMAGPLSVQVLADCEEKRATGIADVRAIRREQRRRSSCRCRGLLSALRYNREQCRLLEESLAEAADTLAELHRRRALADEANEANGASGASDVAEEILNQNTSREAPATSELNWLLAADVSARSEVESLTDDDREPANCDATLFLSERAFDLESSEAGLLSIATVPDVAQASGVELSNDDTVAEHVAIDEPLSDAISASAESEQASRKQPENAQSARHPNSDTAWSWDIETPENSHKTTDLWGLPVAASVIETSTEAETEANRSPAHELGDGLAESLTPTESESELRANAEVAEFLPMSDDSQLVDSSINQAELGSPDRVDALFAAKAKERTNDNDQPSSFIDRYAHLLEEDCQKDDEAKAGANQLDAPMPAPTVAAVTPAVDEEESLDNYMEKMMQRLRGTSEDKSEGSTKPTVSQPRAIASQSKPVASVVTTPLTPEPVLAPFASLDELKKSTAAENAEDLSAFRELANSSARCAIGTAELRQFRDRAGINLSLSAIVLAAGGFLLVNATSAVSLPTIAGGTMMVLGTWWGGRIASQLLRAMRALQEAVAKNG